MTYPLIGNYGVSLADMESRDCFLNGFVVRELSRTASNFRSNLTLQEFLEQRGVVGIAEVDTRAIVKKVRSGKPLRCGISSTESDPDKLLERVRSSASTDGRDLVREVTRSEPERWTEGSAKDQFLPEVPCGGTERLKIVAYDFGIKNNILRCLVECGFEVQVVPAHTTAEEAMAYKPQGIFLSNGPGDPSPVQYAVDTAREFLDRGIPMFGICLGQQILALAMGGRTVKMDFGHHGGNQPVMDRTTGKIEITSQNHSFVVDEASLDPDEVEITHHNLNDQSVEGLRHRKLPVFAVQYHPEAAPGPHDALYLFKRFRDMILAHVPQPAAK
jgi:carbamoyl-phosphate synthase small subunit